MRRSTDKVRHFPAAFIGGEKRQAAYESDVVKHDNIDISEYTILRKRRYFPSSSPHQPYSKSDAEAKSLSEESMKIRKLPEVGKVELLVQQ